MSRRGAARAAAATGRGYALVMAIPTVADYCRLRAIAGLTPRSRTAAMAGLPNSAIAVVVTAGGRAVGMGRVIGDGLCYQVVDIAVDPAHQQRGLGKAIVGALMDELHRIAPAEAYVSLIADGAAHALYAQYGFEPTAPASIGMAQWIGDPAAGTGSEPGGTPPGPSAVHPLSRMSR